jgi:hypothetical protein
MEMFFSYKRNISYCLFKNSANSLIKRVAGCNSRFVNKISDRDNPLAPPPPSSPTPTTIIKPRAIRRTNTNNENKKKQLNKSFGSCFRFLFTSGNSTTFFTNPDRYNKQPRGQTVSIFPVSFTVSNTEKDKQHSRSTNKRKTSAGKIQKIVECIVRHRSNHRR